MWHRYSDIYNQAECGVQKKVTKRRHCVRVLTVTKLGSFAVALVRSSWWGDTVLDTQCATPLGKQMVINGRNMSLQAAGALLIPWLSSCLLLWPFVIFARVENTSTLSYHTRLPAYPIWHFIWLSIQVRLGHNSPKYNILQCCTIQRNKSFHMQFFVTFICEC